MPRFSQPKESTTADIFVESTLLRPTARGRSILFRFRAGSALFAPSSCVFTYLTARVDTSKRAVSGEDDPSGFDDIFLRSSSPAMKSALDRARLFATEDDPVFLEGETGTGKTTLFGFMHRCSRRRQSPSLSLAMSSVDPSLMHSQLFGHRRGAFTGALSNRVGLCVQAKSGSLFLDEIGHSELSLQRTLLDVFDQRRVLPVGADEYVALNCRFITAANVPLDELVATGRFLSDLRYRISMLSIRLPALRERREDLPGIFEWMIRTRAERGVVRRPPPRLHPELLTLVSEAPWPGNLREMYGVVARLLALHRELAELNPDHLLAELPGMPSQTPKRTPRARNSARALPPSDEEVQRVLEECGGDRELAAEQLGVSRATLYRRLKQLRAGAA